MPKPTRHRSAKSGKFVAAKTAKRRPATTVAETRKPRGKLWWGFESSTDSGEKYLDLYSTLSAAKEWHIGEALIKRYRVEEIE